LVKNKSFLSLSKYFIYKYLPGPNKIPWHFHHLRQIEGAMKQEMLVSIVTCAHLVLPGTSKKITNGFTTKRLNQHAKTNSDSSSRPKR
jgi:hypothetical protein